MARPKGNFQFDQDAKDRVCRTIAETGRMYFAAKACGFCSQTVKDHFKHDPEFKAAYDEAMGQYRDSLEEEIHRRAMEGVEEPIIGGKNKNEVVCTVTRYSDRLLELHAKRHISEYREKQMDINVGQGGVLVVGEALTEEEWQEKYGGRKAEPEAE